MTTESAAPATEAPAANAGADPAVQLDAGTPTEPAAPTEGGTAAPVEGAGNDPPGGDPAPADPAADPAADPVVEGAPEAYADFTMPEGMVMDEELGPEFKEWAKAHNLTQVDAQQSVDLASRLVAKTIKAFQDQHAELVTQWAEQAKADPVVGGRNYDANVKTALDAVSQFGDPELTAAFESLGLGNHPAFIRAFYRIGKAAGEGGFVHGQGSEQPAAPKNPVEELAARVAAEQARNPIQRKQIPS